MNARKTETVYVCGNCGQDFSKWQGKCQNCGAWDTITEFRQPKRGPRAKEAAANVSEAVPLASCKPASIDRTPSTFPEVDRVLGGGLVSGALILLGGDPGYRQVDPASATLRPVGASVQNGAVYFGRGIRRADFPSRRAAWPERLVVVAHDRNVDRGDLRGTRAQ